MIGILISKVECRGKWLKKKKAHKRFSIEGETKGQLKLSQGLIVTSVISLQPGFPVNLAHCCPLAPLQHGVASALPNINASCHSKQSKALKALERLYFSANISLFNLLSETYCGSKVQPQKAECTKYSNK